jgi:hypothetical protein
MSDAKTASRKGRRLQPSAKAITGLISMGSDARSKAATIITATIEAGVSSLLDARAIVAACHATIWRKLAEPTSSIVA